MMEHLGTLTMPEQPAEQPRALEAASLQGAIAPAPPAPAPPSVADGVERSLDPRHIALDRIAGWILTGSVALGGIVTILILVLTPVPGWVKGGAVLLWTAVTLALGWFSHRWPVVEHRHAFYKVDEVGIQIRRGVFWRKVINVPRSRVQHTDVSQGPLERRYGLGTLVLYTAGTDHAKVDLAGLDHATALAIRDHLLAGEGGDAV
jgi:membrane protein YdbS with pleckstrin-like domain